MIINNVTRSYSRSINTKSYGGKESWVKIEATYEAQCESGDDPLKVSEMLNEQAQKDVAASVNIVIEKIKAANPNTVPQTMPPAGAPQNTGGAPVSTTVPANGPRSL